MPDFAAALIPYIICRNATEAVEFYKRAFSAQVGVVHSVPDGRILHAALKIQGNSIFVCDEFPEHGGKSPLTLNGTPITLHLQVPDCDAVFNQAVSAGGTVVMPMADQFWGDRYGMISDPYGHNWSIATPGEAADENKIKETLATL